MSNSPGGISTNFMPMEFVNSTGHLIASAASFCRFRASSVERAGSKGTAGHFGARSEPPSCSGSRLHSRFLDHPPAFTSTLAVGSSQPGGGGGN